MEMGEIMKRHVLRFLPAKSLCRFRAVCKDWDEWITFPFLAHQQANYFRKISGFFCQTPSEEPFFISLDQLAYGIPSPSLSFLPEDVTIRNSCNGLLCCQSRFGDAYYVCNPVNERWEELPLPTLYHGPASAIALAFEPSPYNFKSHFEIVCVVPFSFVKAVYFEIYSSRTNSWRVVESEYVYDGDALEFKGDGFYMNGFMYWETLNGVILAFSLKDEQHGNLQLPVDHQVQGILTTLHGELCYIMPHENENDECLLNIYGEHNMVLKHQIPLDVSSFGEDLGELQVMHCVDNNVVIVLVGRSVIAYDAREREAKIITEVHFEGYSSMRFLPYVNSLVSVCLVHNMPAE